MSENCSICGCILNRSGKYATPTIEGRSHATKHHYVAERFFGRSKNRPNEKRTRIFSDCPWGIERQEAVYCYECHEELLHNPVFLPKDVKFFAELVTLRNLNEEEKSESREKLAGRIILFHEIIEAGIKALLRE